MRGETRGASRLGASSARPIAFRAQEYRCTFKKRRRGGTKKGKEEEREGGGGVKDTIKSSTTALNRSGHGRFSRSQYVNSPL